MNSNSTEYIISLDQFEGPLDLLYQLIQKRKLQINTITLAKVTTDYIAHVRKREVLPAEEVAHFIHTASILVLIKSKSLLPVLEYTQGEEVDVQVLESRVRLFDYIQKKAVPALRDWKKQVYIVEAPKQKEQIVFSPDKSCTTKGLHRNALAAVQNVAVFKQPKEKKVHKTISIEDIIEKVLKTVSERTAVSFKDLAAKGSKQEKIVSFLAILELMRKNVLMAEQCKEFDDIVLTRQSA